MGNASSIRESLISLYQELRRELNAKFNRSLPFEEMLFDRWERAEFLGFGKKTSIHQSSYVYGNVSIGEDVWIGPFTILDGSGSLEIGNNCSISAGVQIYSHDTVNKRLSAGRMDAEKGSVKIGSHCYIGPNAVISKNVVIGDYCVVGANSFVKTSMPAYSVAVGSPAKIRGKVVIDSQGNHKISWEKK